MPLVMASSVIATHGSDYLLLETVRRRRKEWMASGDLVFPQSRVALSSAQPTRGAVKFLLLLALDTAQLPGNSVPSS